MALAGAAEVVESGLAELIVDGGVHSSLL